MRSYVERYAVAGNDRRRGQHARAHRYDVLYLKRRRSYLQIVVAIASVVHAARLRHVYDQRLTAGFEVLGQHRIARAGRIVVDG